MAAHDRPADTGVMQPQNTDELLEVIVHNRVVHTRVHIISILGYNLFGTIRPRSQIDSETHAVAFEKIELNPS
jgi:hypothetical protein